MAEPRDNGQGHSTGVLETKSQGPAQSSSPFVLGVGLLSTAVCKPANWYYRMTILSEQRMYSVTGPRLRCRGHPAEVQGHITGGQNKEGGWVPPANLIPCIIATVTAARDSWLGSALEFHWAKNLWFSATYWKTIERHLPSNLLEKCHSYTDAKTEKESIKYHAWITKVVRQHRNKMKKSTKIKLKHMEIGYINNREFKTAVLKILNELKANIDR